MIIQIDATKVAEELALQLVWKTYSLKENITYQELEGFLQHGMRITQLSGSEMLNLIADFQRSIDYYFKILTNHAL